MLELEGITSVNEKKLTARVSTETHRRVRTAALEHGVTVDKYIEDAVLIHLRERNIGSDTLNVSVATKTTLEQLPESFVRDVCAIYEQSVDVFFSLARIVGAVARGVSISEAIGASDTTKDRARLERVKPLPSDGEKDKAS